MLLSFFRPATHGRGPVKEGPMSAKWQRDVIRRSPRNPVISIEDLPFRCADIWNAGLTRFAGRYLMLITIETLEGQYRIYKAMSDDGENFTVEEHPFMIPSHDERYRIHESMGVRDPRITPIGDSYYLTYLAEGDHGLRVGLARTGNFTSLQRLGYPSQVDVKSGALFPTRFNGRYALLKRPAAGASIWVSYSADLKFWGDEKVVMAPRRGYWDSARVGAAAPPVEIDKGWLLIYYGEKVGAVGPLVRLGAAVLDRDDPSVVLARSDIPILAPREPYERIGDVPNVVFSCGALLDGEEIMLCYGASDSCICLGTATLKEVVEACFEGERNS